MLSACIRRGLPAVLMVCTLPAVLQADSFTCRNDCRLPVVVQIVSVQRGVPKRDQGTLKFGETSPKVPLDTDKVLMIFDKSGRQMFREVIKVNPKPQQFSIVPDPRFPNRVRLMVIPPPQPVPGEAPPMGKR